MLSTSAAPLKILLFLESAYIRSVVNTGMSRQRSRLGRVTVLTGRSDQAQDLYVLDEPDEHRTA